MNPELEGLVLAFDAVRQAKTGPEAKRLEELYRMRLDDVLARHRSLTPDRLQSLVDYQHRRWVLAQKKHASLPPNA